MSSGTVTIVALAPTHLTCCQFPAPCAITQSGSPHRPYLRPNSTSHTRATTHACRSPPPSPSTQSMASCTTTWVFSFVEQNVKYYVLYVTSSRGGPALFGLILSYDFSYNRAFSRSDTC